MESRVGIRNTSSRYGVIAILLHWLVALVVIGLFALGIWMTGLTYYDDWYKRGPDIHKSIGILLFFVMLARVVWRAGNVTPEDEPGTGSLQRRLAHGVHLLLYVLLFAMMISGYLISTADGKPIQVFGLFAVPATISDIPNQEDVAGKVHWYLALTVIGLAVLHAAAALKHHFIDHDRTLKKMLGVRSQPQPSDNTDQ
ncbi:MAG: cytochrome b [Thiotrichales bacterium]|nr:MAG: cytochrome b [Thiotrichales bacterium]